LFLGSEEKTPAIPTEIFLFPPFGFSQNCRYFSHTWYRKNGSPKAEIGTIWKLSTGGNHPQDVGVFLNFCADILTPN
jgi:hypothetical protein